MVNFNEVIDKFISELSRFKGEISQSLSALDAKAEQLKSNQADLAKEKENLAERQKAIDEIEDIVRLEAEAKKMLKEAQEKMGALSKAQDSFDNFRNEKMKEIRTLEQTLAEKGSYIRKEYEALQKAQKALEQDKATYKDRVAKSIVDLANKK